MTKFIGEEKLIQQAKRELTKGITQVCDNIYFILGYGESTATLIIGENSCILIDSLSSQQAAQEALLEINKLTNKPIKTIIYTHYQHPDHTGGAGVFAFENCDIIARKSPTKPLGRSNLLSDIYQKRAGMQFGMGLSAQESISIGIGPSKNPRDTKLILAPTTLFDQQCLKLEIDGIKLELIAAPGETDEQIFVWLPDQKVLCCGDNYYASWPNIYAIRGGQYRDVDTWINTLTNIITYDANYLLPGHTRAVIGKDNVKTTLTNYRDAIDHVFVSTLIGMNEGKTEYQLVNSIKLPEHLVNLTYLQEHYGTIAWSIRSIFCGYFGWFNGNATQLNLMDINDKACKTVKLMGGENNVLNAINAAILNNEEQWALELCDILLDGNYLIEQAKQLKLQALVNIGRMQTSANARHYYLKSAKNLSN